MKTLNSAVARVLKRLHYPLEVILTCVRWYVAYPLSLRHLEDMMAERGVSVDHSTVHRWAIKLLPVLEKAFSPPQAAGWQELAHGRDVHPRQGRVAISIPSR
jgi:transposase-like protein